MNIKKPFKKFFWGITVCFSVLIIACGFYVNDYYRADTASIAAFSAENPIQTSEYERTIFFYPNKEPLAGLIFYPGGKVDHTAYTPLMVELAQRGILCALVEMPFHLAVFDSDAAEHIPAQFSNVHSWYLCGHSLGGAMASSYLSHNSADFQGLILLGAYSTADLSKSGLSVLSVCGSEDLVLNRDAYEKNQSNLPKDLIETVLEGGCHAGFGMYGPQKGDGSPTLSSAEQITQTADLISEFICGLPIKIP